MIRNPISRAVSFYQTKFLRICCPACGDTYFVELRDIHPRDGCLAYCPTCQNLSFIPGVYRDSISPQSATITSEIIMPIDSVKDWLKNHPFVKMSGGIKEYRGLFLFCPKCHRQYDFKELMNICHLTFSKCSWCKNTFVRVLLVENHPPGRVKDYLNFVIGYSETEEGMKGFVRL